MSGILAGIIDLIFPPRCVTCMTALAGNGPPPFCPTCRAGITLIGSPLCPRCGIPFPNREGSDHLCGECLVNERPYETMRSLGVYEKTLLEAIHRFKYQGRAGLGRILGAMLADRAVSLWGRERFSLIVPVPLHKRRLRERGFNQALVLARVVARRLGLPLDFWSLKRSAATAPQVGLGREARTRNVRGAFSLRRPGRLAGQRILLIDDVCTTGSTLNECATLLRQGGAQTVTVLTLARAVPDHACKEA